MNKNLAFDPESVYTALDPWIKLNDVLCLKYDRKVGSDQTVSFQGQKYLLSGGATSATNLMASFQIGFNSQLKVFVFNEELNFTPVLKPHTIIQINQKL